MPAMPVTKTLEVTDRHEWRQWLMEHHDSESEIWLIYASRASGKPRIPYLHAVEEALCFGWIDGIEKKVDAEHSAQRFTPRRPKSNWTELNKERARRLIARGQMTEAGRAKLPDLALDAFQIAPDILAKLQEDPAVWAHFQAFPALYQRVRIGFIEEVRRQPAVFEKRLNYFLKQTRQNKVFGTLE